LNPSPVKRVAIEHHIPLLQPEALQEKVLSVLRSMEPDLFLVAAYGKILPQKLLDIPKHGSLNVHPSLLPLYRGSAPVQNTLLSGDEKTGVTVILMDEKMDHGMILAQREFSISKPTHQELHNALAELGGSLLAEVIPQWVAGTIKPVPQNDSEATYTRRFIKEDGKIDWSRPAVYIERQVRALQPWPGAYTQGLLPGKTLKILRARLLPGIHAAVPGRTFAAPTQELGVQTGKDALVVEVLQQEGKKPMSSKEFLLGHQDILNARFE
ncbi:MAG: methionyl-tRNA formyltransferase, partial [Parcubacteria group bacterium]|nr:methionyl-tRNA formyltransferase [Parcubacteria group bacterium]